MPLSVVLRDGFQRNADVLEPEVDRLLEDVFHRTRRRRLVRRAAVVIAAAGAVVLGALFGPWALDALRRPSVPATIAPPTGAAQSLAGAFTRHVEPDRAVVRSHSMAGDWTIDLREGGAITVFAPPGFSGVLSDFQFQLAGDRFRTNLFAQDLCVGSPIGTYHWQRSGRTLTFTAVEDRCAARVALFAGGPWHP